MRGTRVLGRFDIDYEAHSIYEGIADDLRTPVGNVVDWWVWDQENLEENYEEVVDDIYDTSKASLPSSSGTVRGRKWLAPFTMPVVMAQVIRGANIMNERGFYTTDTLRIVINVRDIENLIPEMLPIPEQHLKDRIVYKGQVFTPTRLLPRGHFADRYAVITVDCNEVNPEELVNDSQFQEYALAAVQIQRPVPDPEEDLSDPEEELVP